MTKTIFEEMGGTYRQVGDYLLPNITVPAEEEIEPIGLWGKRHASRGYVSSTGKGICRQTRCDGTIKER